MCMPLNPLRSLSPGPRRLLTVLSILPVLVCTVGISVEAHHEVVSGHWPLWLAAVLWLAWTVGPLLLFWLTTYVVLWIIDGFRRK